MTHHLLERLAQLRKAFESYPAVTTAREHTIEETARRALVLAEDAIRCISGAPLARHIFEQLATDGTIDGSRGGGEWVYGESVRTDQDIDPKGKAVRERFNEVLDDIRKAGYEVNDKESDSDHDSFWITFRRPALNVTG